jgi:ribosomal protein S12
MGAPMRKGVVYKIATMTPRKPNSARRTFAKVRIILNQKKNFCKNSRYRRSLFTSTFCCVSSWSWSKRFSRYYYHLVRGVYDFDKVETYGRKIDVQNLELKN